MNSKTFGEYLTQLRIDAGFEDRESLSKASGVWNSTIKRLEEGITKHPSIDVLKKLAPALNTSYEELMQAIGYIEDKKSGAFIMIQGSDGRKMDISDLRPEDQQAIFAMAEYYKTRKK